MRGRGRGGSARCCTWGCGSGRCCTRCCLGVGLYGGSRTITSLSMGQACITCSSSATTRASRSQAQTEQKWNRQQKVLGPSKKKPMLILPVRPLSLSGVPATPVNNQNHLCLHIPGKPKRFLAAWLRSMHPGAFGAALPSLCWGNHQSPADSPSLSCSELWWKQDTESKVRCNHRKQYQSTLPCHYQC